MNHAFHLTFSCACSYPAYAPTPLSIEGGGLSTLYWGGPALGLNKTTTAIPNGADVLAYFDNPNLPSRHIPAVIL